MSRLPLPCLALIQLLLGFNASWAEGGPPVVPAHTFRAGAGIVSVSPTKFPVHISGMHPDRTSSALMDELYSRALVLDDGRQRLVIVVVDSCMMPRDLLDRAKELASAATGIPIDRMLISATHTHSAPAAMALLGTPEDANYVKLLPGRIAQSIELAASHLEPARIGWTVIQDPIHVHSRRGILRSDKRAVNPFGEQTDLVDDPGYDRRIVTGPSGPSDPDISVIALQASTGRPIALLANYGNHYFGMPELVDNSPVISADYFGLFDQMIDRLIHTGNPFPGPAEAIDTQHPPFVGMMSQGTSGDQRWQDLSEPAADPGIQAYSEAIAREVFQAYQTIQYRDWAPLTMAETKVRMQFRVPDASRLAWAHRVIADAHGKRPTNVGRGEKYRAAMPYAYAVQQIYLHEHPTAELKLQAIRIGDLGITAIPNEVFALSGLKIKEQSPLHPTINIELANGAEGYLPPPEQFLLGGYTTWPAHSAGLEAQAEPRIVEAVLALLEEVSGRARRPIVDTNGAYAQSILNSNPRSYWRLNEQSGPTARDATGKDHPAAYEGGIAYYLPGPASPAFSGQLAVNRAPHLVGGRIAATLADLGPQYTLEFWFWNGFPADVRDVTGWLFSVGDAKSCSSETEDLGLSGLPAKRGRLIFTSRTGSQAATAMGTAEIPLRSWTYVAFVHAANRVDVYVNGSTTSDISIDVAACELKSANLSLGALPESGPGLEGKIDEVAVYDRALTPLEILDHFRISAVTAAASK